MSGQVKRPATRGRVWTLAIGLAAAPRQGLRGQRPLEGGQRDVGGRSTSDPRGDRQGRAGVGADPRSRRSPSSLPRCTTGPIATTMRWSSSARRFARDPRHAAAAPSRGDNAAAARRAGRHPGFLRQRAEDRPRRCFAQFVMIPARQLRRLGRRAGLVDRAASETGGSRSSSRCPVWGKPFARLLRALSLRVAAFAEQPARVGETLFGPHRDLHDRGDREATSSPSRCSLVSRSTPRSTSCTTPRPR